MSGRAETAARWLLSLPPDETAAVVERLSRETLEEIRAALERLGAVASLAEGPGPGEPASDDRFDDEPPFLLAAVLAATPPAGRDGFRAGIAARCGPEVLAAMDTYAAVSPVAAAIEAIGHARETGR